MQQAACLLYGSFNMGQVVVGGYQVDIGSTLLLQLQENFAQPVCCDGLAVCPAADLVVLAKAAAQTAAGEKHRSAARRLWSSPADAGLFPVMQCGAAYQKLAFAAASARFAFAVSTAVARA